MSVTEFDRLVEIMKRLREGCPWDREQTHRSLRPYLLEETYEALEALDEGCPEKLREELGDLLLQIVFHCEVARQAGEFDVRDVIAGICEKLIRRHPHVFGDAQAETPEDVTRNWARIKRKDEGIHSHLDGLPKTLSALLRAQRAQSKAHRSGLPTESREALFQRVFEYLERLEDLDGGEDAEHLMGHILLDLVEIGRGTRIVAEDALREATEQFVHRFRRMENLLRREGTDVTEATPEAIRSAWEQADQAG